MTLQMVRCSPFLENNLRYEQRRSVKPASGVCLMMLGNVWVSLCGMSAGRGLRIIPICFTWQHVKAVQRTQNFMNELYLK